MKRIIFALGALLIGGLGFAADGIASEPRLACDGSVIDPARLHAEGTGPPTVPPEIEEPVPVEIRLQVMELSAIDPISSSFHFEAYVDFRFCDPRSAFDAEEEGRPTRRFFGVGIDYPIWDLKLRLANGLGAFEVTQRLIEIAADGSIYSKGYFNSEVSTNFDLRLFPFDRQELTIHIESFTHPNTVVQLVTDDDFVSISPDINAPEWHIEGIRTRSDNVLNPRESTPFSRAVLTIDVARESTFYLFKLWLPLTLIVALSWSVFWMPDESLAGRIRISATSFLTVVAYQFAIVGSLPKVAYLTLMDRLMIGSFILIALTAVQSMWSVSRRATDPEGAERLDRRSRWTFPLVYVGWVVTAWIIYAD